MATPTSPEIYSPVAEGYATPAQIQQVYEYAKLLTNRGGQHLEGTGWNAVPGGLANLVNVLHGNAQRQHGDELQQQALQARSTGMDPTLFPAVPNAAPGVVPPKVGNSDDAPPAQKAASEGGASVYALNGGGDFPMVKPDTTAAPKDELAEALNGGPKALALSATPQEPSDDGVQAIARALQPGEKKTQTAQSSKWGPPIVPPEMVPRRPMYSREQVMSIMRNPTVSEAEREKIRQEYIHQYDPIEVPAPNGAGTVLINPANPYQQMPKYVIDKSAKEFPGGYKPADRQYVDRNGVVHTLPQVEDPIPGAPPPAPGLPTQAPGQPGSPAAPFAPGGPTPPPGPQITPPAAPGPTPDPLGGVGPGIPHYAPEENEQFTPAKPNAYVPGGQVVAQNFDSLATTPPAAAPPVGAGMGLPTGTPGAPPLPPGVSPRDAQVLNYFRDNAIQQKAREESATEGAKIYAKRYEDMAVAGHKAMDEEPLLNLAGKIASRPDFYSGLGNGVVLDWNRAKAAFGRMIGGDQGKELENSARPQELFTKIISGSILSGLRAALAGTGQVRVAEIELLKNANASPMNTVASNKALINIAQRTNQRVIDLHTMAADFASGNAVVNPVTGKVLVAPNVKNGEIEPRGGLNASWDKAVNQFYKESPTFNKDEVENYEKTFSEDKDQAPGAATAAPGIRRYDSSGKLIK